MHSGDENELETPQEKRLRLAKKYLEEIEKEEKARAEDKADINEELSKRLNNEYLDSVGKLRTKIADNYESFDSLKIVSLRHKTQKFSATCFCVTTDGRYLFTGSKSTTVVKWDISENPPKHVGIIDCLVLRIPAEKTKNIKQKVPKVQIACLAISTDNKFLAVGDMSNGVRIYCPQTLKPLGIFKDHRDTVTSLVFRRDSHELYSASKDRSVIIWSMDEMAKIEIMYGHQAGITGIDALSRDRAITAGGSDSTIRIWKINEESQLVYNGHTGHNIDSVKLINDENFLSCGDDGALCVWSAMKKKPLCTVSLAHGSSVGGNGEANWISAIATHINSDLIASGSCDGFIRIWKLADNFRKCLQIMEIPVKGFVNCLAFSGDGHQLIAAIGQEHKLGRWWHNSEAKNCTLLIPLTMKSV